MPVNEQAKKQRRSSHQTQWAAQFAVASELCRRGYEVAFTTGNHPCIDLMAMSPKQVPFVVDVKGLYMKNFWLVRERPARSDLFYVFVFGPPGAAKVRFFILTQEQFNIAIRGDFAYAQGRAKGKARTMTANPMPGVEWKYAERWEDAWDSFPS